MPVSVEELENIGAPFRNRTFLPHSVNSCLALGEKAAGFEKLSRKRVSRQREHRLVDAKWGKNEKLEPRLDVPAFLEYNLKIQLFQRHYSYATCVKLCLSECILNLTPKVHPSVLNLGE